MKLHEHQQDVADSVMKELDEKYGGKTVILRSIPRPSGKYIAYLEHKRGNRGYDINFECNSKSDLCWVDEINVDDSKRGIAFDGAMQFAKSRGAIKAQAVMVDTRKMLRDFQAERNIYARHPQFMLIDDWRSMCAFDVFKKAVHLRNTPQNAGFNRLLTIYWHNYYMDDLQGTFDGDTLSLLTNGYKVAAYGLFNMLPRLTYVRACIAKIIVFGGNDDASTAD